MVDEKNAIETTTREMKRSENRTLVLVAVIGVASAILGSAVGGYFSSLQTSRQLDAASKQIIYNDKKAAYVDYSKADGDLYDLEYNFGQNFVINNSLPEVRTYLADQLRKYNDAITHFHQIQDNIYLIESDDIRSKREQSEGVPVLPSTENHRGPRQPRWADSTPHRCRNFYQLADTGAAKEITSGDGCRARGPAERYLGGARNKLVRSPNPPENRSNSSRRDSAHASVNIRSRPLTPRTVRAVRNAPSDAHISC